MREFEEEVQEKKALARNNRYKTGWGQRPTKAFEQPEPSEKEIEKKHGEVMEYKIGQPITWAEFKKYPKEMQQEWVNAFTEKFECSTKGMSILFGLHNTSINSHCQKREITIPKTGVYNEKKATQSARGSQNITPLPLLPNPPRKNRRNPNPRNPNRIISLTPFKQAA